MIYTSEADFRYDTKLQDIAPWLTPFCHFVLAFKLLSGDRSQICRDANNGLLNTHKIPTDSECNDLYPGGRRKI